MPTPTGAGRLKLRRWPPPPRPPALHPGSSCSLPPDPRLQLRRSLPRRQTPCTTGLAPGSSARSPGPDLSPRPIPGLPGGRRTRAGPPPGPRPRAGGRTGRPARPHPHAGDGAARRPPGKDKDCSAAGRTVPGSPRPPPRWPPTRPPCVCSAGRGCTVRTASGRRRLAWDPACPTSSANSGATAPFSVSPGQLRWPCLLEPGWTARGLRQRPEF